jgi:uncharacterized protein YggE
MRTDTTDTADNSVTITVSERVSAGTVTLCEASAANASAVAQTWETMNLTTFGGGCSLTAGDTLLIQIHMDAEANDYADVGRLEITYTN